MKLENNEVKIEFTLKGAEITSFIDKKTNREIIWQAKPEFWSGRNPVLFPQVGNTWSKSYITKGKQYAMGNHGFARNSTFEQVELTANKLVLLLKDNEETYSQYPYHFKFYVTYSLEGKKLDIKYDIINEDDEVMPFGFGLHPAFNCPISDDELFEDYYIEFPSIESQTVACKEALVDSKIKLDYKWFKKYPTLIYEYVESPYVELVSSKNRIKVGVNGYRYLAFWTKENAPFICIEPWHSHGDFEENDLPFSKREGMINLESKRQFTTAYYIEIV